MRIHVARHTAVPPDAAYAWWTDFEAGHDAHDFAPGHDERRIVEGPDNDGRLVIEDSARWGPWLFLERYTVELQPHARAVRVRGVNSLAIFRATYAFEATKDGGTRVSLEADVAPLGIVGALLGPLGWPLARHVLGKDLKEHLRQMEGDALQEGP